MQERPGVLVADASSCTLFQRPSVPCSRGQVNLVPEAECTLFQRPSVPCSRGRVYLVPQAECTLFHRPSVPCSRGRVYLVPQASCTLLQRPPCVGYYRGLDDGLFVCVRLRQLYSECVSKSVPYLAEVMSARAQPSKSQACKRRIRGVYEACESPAL